MSHDLDATRETPLSADELERLVAALLEVDPSAERSDLDGGEVEIDTPLAIQVFLARDEAGMHVPYWYEGEEAERVMERVFE